MNNFDESYTQYWEQRVKQLSDGTRIADSDIADTFLPFLNIAKTDTLLDMGCSYGRFFPLLSKYSDNIIGVDIEPNAIQKASEFGYQKLIVSGLESMPIKSNSIECGFCWATFDCTEQEEVLKECNRILKQGGRILITGKNIEYASDDEIAFIAERNARLKSFPNHFTNLPLLFETIAQWGFAIEEGFAFRNRGDFGNAKGFRIDKSNIDTPFYEYAIVIRKTADNNAFTQKICDTYSDTARKLAEKNGFNDPFEFFKHHKATSGIE